MKLPRAPVVAPRPLSDGVLPSDNGGKVDRLLREQRPVSPPRGTAPAVRSEQRRTAEHGESHATAAPAAPSPLCEQWAERHAGKLRTRQHDAHTAAQRSGKPWTLHADEQTRAILADCPAREVSAATAAKYRRAYDNLRASGLTALEASSTRAHWDFLRTATRFCMETDVRAWRAASERARKRGDLASAQRRTERAWRLATALDLQFLQPDRPTWAKKAAQMKAAGQSVPDKSKRKGAPPPDAMLLSLVTGERRGTALAERHGERLAMAALFSMRPAEAMKGVRLAVEGKGSKRLLTAQIKGAKVDGKRGQALRLVGIPVKGAAAELLAARVEAEGGRWRLDTTAADYRSMNRALQPLGLSWYSLRHQIGSELKEAVSTGAIAPEEAAAVMGHRSSLSLSYYGTRTRARGGRKFRGKAGEPVRVVPVSRAQKAKARTERDAEKSIKAGQALAPKARPAAKSSTRAAATARPWDYSPPAVRKAPKPPTR